MSEEKIEVTVPIGTAEVPPVVVPAEEKSEAVLADVLERIGKLESVLQNMEVRLARADAWDDTQLQDMFDKTAEVERRMTLAEAELAAVELFLMDEEENEDNEAAPEIVNAPKPAEVKVPTGEKSPDHFKNRRQKNG